MIYFVLVDYFCLSVYFEVAKVTAKIVQASEKASSLLECFSESRLSYEKRVQASGMTKQNTQFLFFIPERRLSYEKRDLYNVENKSEKYIIWKLINK